MVRCRESACRRSEHRTCRVLVLAGGASPWQTLVEGIVTVLPLTPEVPLWDAFAPWASPSHGSGDWCHAHLWHTSPSVTAVGRLPGQLAATVSSLI
jgi:hypothetical protein